jgi:hypothetical protein
MTRPKFFLWLQFWIKQLTVIDYYERSHIYSMYRYPRRKGIEKIVLNFLPHFLPMCFSRKYLLLIVASPEYCLENESIVLLITQ